MNHKRHGEPRAAQPQPNGNGFNRKERKKRKEAVPLSLPLRCFLIRAGTRKCAQENNTWIPCVLARRSRNQNPNPEFYRSTQRSQRRTSFGKISARFASSCK